MIRSEFDDFVGGYIGDEARLGCSAQVVAVGYVTGELIFKGMTAPSYEQTPRNRQYEPGYVAVFAMTRPDGRTDHHVLVTTIGEADPISTTTYPPSVVEYKEDGSVYIGQPVRMVIAGEGAYAQHRLGGTRLEAEALSQAQHRVA